MSNLNPTADEFLLGGSSGKSAFAKNDPIGATVTGTVIGEPQVRQQTDLETGKPLEWENGDPRMQLVVTLLTDQRIEGEPDDDGIRAVYVKGSKAPGCQSLHDAVRAAAPEGLRQGGVLTVQLIGTEPSKTRGFNDRKLWAARYVAPDAAAASSGFLGVGGQPATAPQPVSTPAVQPVSAPAPTAPPAPPAPAAADTPAAKAKSLAALGLTPEQIAPQLGLDPTVVAMLIAA